MYGLTIQTPSDSPLNLEVCKKEHCVVLFCKETATQCESFERSWLGQWPGWGPAKIPKHRLCPRAQRARPWAPSEGVYVLPSSSSKCVLCTVAMICSESITVGGRGVPETAGPGRHSCCWARQPTGPKQTPHAMGQTSGCNPGELSLGSPPCFCPDCGLLQPTGHLSTRTGTQGRAASLAPGESGHPPQMPKTRHQLLSLTQDSYGCRANSVGE